VKETSPNKSRSIFKNLTEEKLDELLEILGYETPLYGMLQTGDEIPIWVLIAIIIGICALIIAFLLRKNI